MSYVKNGIVQSLASGITMEVRESRRERLAQNPNSLKRAAVLLVHDVVVRYPRVSARALGLDYQPSSLAFVGAGDQSTVFRSSETEVTKVNNRSVLWSPAVRAAEAERARAAHLAMAEHLCDFVLPQTIFIGEHPFFSHSHAIQITQPYQEIIDPQLFEGGSRQDVKRRLLAMRDDYPAATTSLGNFVDGSRRLYDEHRLLPDTIGHKNVVIADDDSLLIIDGQPISTSLPKEQNLIRDQLNQIESLLAEVA